jgi:hypothetical protein
MITAWIIEAECRVYGTVLADAGLTGNREYDIYLIILPSTTEGDFYLSILHSI